jgi:hypothetical protein
MPSPDPFKVTAPAAPIDTSGPIDWIATKTAILARLDLHAEYAALGVRFAGSQGKEWCECHAIDRADETPSAAINVKSGLYKDLGGDGAVTGFFDFALKHGPHGRWIDVIKFYAAKVGLELGKIQAHSGGRVREATYEYQDEAGEVRYAVFRYRTPNGKKSFSQHPPDGKGGWRFGADCMKGVEPLPYRLPELLASADADDPIFVVEGEKDVERLRSHALTATTNHQGASSTDATWPHFVRFFKNRDVFILPDNDPGGKIHARKVAAYLHGTARTLRVVELPGLPPKGDVSDWLDLGHTLDELDKLISGTKFWEPSDEGLVKLDEGAKPAVASEEDGLPSDEDVITVCLRDVQPEKVQWLWPDRIPLRKLTTLAGEAKQGKSFLTMDLIARITSGAEIPCGGGECFEVGSVVLLSAEDDLGDTIVPRLLACGADMAKIHALTTIKLANGQFGPFNLAYMPHLERAVLRAGDCRAVIIDPVPHYIGMGVDDHKNAQTRAILEPLRELAASREIAVVMVTHLNKGSSTKALNRVTGSGAYTALSRANWLVCKSRDDPKRRLMLSAGINLVEEPPGLAYRIDRETRRIIWEDKPVYMTADEALADLASEAKAEKVKSASKTEQAEAWLAELLAARGSVLSADIFKEGSAKGYGRDVLFEAKKRLGLPAVKQGFGGAWAWTLPPQESDGPQRPNGSNSSDPSYGSGEVGAPF